MKNQSATQSDKSNTPREQNQNPSQKVPQQDAANVQDKDGLQRARNDGRQEIREPRNESRDEAARRNDKRPSI